MLGVGLRPHLKSAKSFQAIEAALSTAKGPATVSTLKEAEEFGQCGVSDLLYAVAISPQKLERVSALRRSGVSVLEPGQRVRVEVVDGKKGLEADRITLI